MPLATLPGLALPYLVFLFEVRRTTATLAEPMQ